MHLPPFDVQAPASLNEALALLKEHGPAAAVLAGGTDLIPRLRQRLVKADLVLSLKNLPELKAVILDGVILRIGAAVEIDRVIQHPEVQAQLPGLAEALDTVGARGIQHFTGTVGGNLLLESRCMYYNQSDWWRSGRDRCYKNGGQVCHAVTDGKECSSSNQSDGAIMLTALSAQAVIQDPDGEKIVPLPEFFSGVGESPFTLQPEELLTEIRIILPAPGTGMSYRKLRWRSAIDFPLVSAAAVVAMTKDKVDRARLVIGAAGPAPLVVDEAERILRNQTADADLIEQAALAAENKAAGLIVENAIAPAEYRRKMVRVMARRALTAAKDRAAASG